MKHLTLFSLLFAFASAAPALAAPASQPATRPAIVSAADWGSTPEAIPDARKHTPKFVTIHHAGVEWKPGGDPAKFVKSMQAWGQKEKKWPDLPYHFLIAPDGRIYEGRSMDYEPESNTKYKLQGNIGVELMGNFEVQRVSLAQLESVAKLVAWICVEKHIDPSQIRGHKDVAETDCPGKDFYRYIKDGDVRSWVQETIKSGTAKVELKPAITGGPTTMIGQPR